MVRYCVICGYEQVPDHSTSLFSVPKDSDTRERWHLASGKILKVGSFVCMYHFPPEDIVNRRLKYGALPTIVTKSPKVKPQNIKQEDVEIAEQFVDDKGIHDTRKFVDDSETVCKTHQTNQNQVEIVFVKVEETHEDEINDVETSDIMTNKSTNHEVGVLWKYQPTKKHDKDVSVKQENLENDDYDSNRKTFQLKQHQCHFCDYATNKNKSLKRHINAVHLKRKHHECVFCNYATNRKQNLKVHVESVHFNLKPYKCNLCNYTANTNYGLKSHINSAHLDVRKHKCHLCTYASNLRTSLQTHINSVHLKLNRHLCSFVTNEQKDMKKHMVSIHGTGKYPICQK